MEVIYVRPETKRKLFALKERNGFKDLDATVSFLIEFYETYTRRKLLFQKLGFEEVWKMEKLGFVDAKSLEVVRVWVREEVLGELEEWLEKELEVAEEKALEGSQYFEIYAEALRDVLSKIQEIRGEA